VGFLQDRPRQHGSLFSRLIEEPVRGLSKFDEDRVDGQRSFELNGVVLLPY
jgi:hypothetical protein